MKNFNNAPLEAHDFDSSSAYTHYLEVLEQAALASELYQALENLYIAFPQEGANDTESVRAVLQANAIIYRVGGKREMKRPTEGTGGVSEERIFSAMQEGND